MTIQTWASPVTDWELNSIQNVDDINRVENNLLHLKQSPCEDFDLMGRVGQGWFTSAATIIMFYVAKRIPPRSSLYLREVSKCFPNPDGNKRYVLLKLNSIETYPANTNLNWYTAPDVNPLVRWISTKGSNMYIENYFYSDLGLKLVSNPLYVSAYLSFICESLTSISAKNSPEDTVYMRFHVGYDDI